MKKINAKTIKLIKFYNFINYNLIYNNKAINRYKKDTFEISSNKAEKLEKLKKSLKERIKVFKLLLLLKAHELILM